MKKVLVLLSLFFIGFNYSYAQVSTKDFDKLQWLVGEWKRTNSKAGTSGIEKWVKISSSELHGSGVSTKENDTAFC